MFNFVHFLLCNFCALDYMNCVLVAHDKQHDSLNLMLMKITQVFLNNDHNKTLT